MLASTLPSCSSTALSAIPSTRSPSLSSATTCLGTSRLQLTHFLQVRGYGEDMEGEGGIRDGRGRDGGRGDEGWRKG